MYVIYRSIRPWVADGHHPVPRLLAQNRIARHPEPSDLLSYGHQNLEQTCAHIMTVRSQYTTWGGKWILQISCFLCRYLACMLLAVSATSQVARGDLTLARLSGRFGVLFGRPPGRLLQISTPCGCLNAASLRTSVQSRHSRSVRHEAVTAYRSVRAAGGQPRRGV